AAEGAAVLRDVLADNERADTGEQVRRRDGEEGDEPGDAPGRERLVGEHEVVKTANAVGEREHVTDVGPPARYGDERLRAGAEDHHHVRDGVVDDLDAFVDQCRASDYQGQADGSDHDGDGGQQGRDGPVQVNADERRYDSICGRGHE